MNLSMSRQHEVDRLLKELDFVDLYKSYEWNGDTWEKGFPDLFRLEQEISGAARRNSLGKVHLLQIAKWGRYPNPATIDCDEPIRIGLYHDGAPAEWLSGEPENAVLIIAGRTRGLGPTYSSKVLHFAVPQIFGAIDTRLVRTFGRGDHQRANRYLILDLEAEEEGKHWKINAPPVIWPREYGTWIKILNDIAGYLNEKSAPCPHPQRYYEAGLRGEGVWLPADVETALFSYASQVVKGK